MSEVNPAVAALIARYRTTPAADAPAAPPNVNPPEAARVLEEQTAPEVAGVAPAPEPVAAPEPEPAPAPEPPKAKRGPGRPAKAAAPAPEPATSGPIAATDWVERATTEQIVAELRDRGYRVTLEER